jgi:CO/xanthine dehydrogenase Mo-binding subunit
MQAGKEPSRRLDDGRHYGDMRLREDGPAEVHCAAVEVVQGVVDVILQVARTELRTDDVMLSPVTTATAGSAGSSSASRMTWMAAGAVQMAYLAALEERRKAGGGDVERVYRHVETVGSIRKRVKTSVTVPT